MIKNKTSLYKIAAIFIALSVIIIAIIVNATRELPEEIIAPAPTSTQDSL
jgi:hypothetical protein